MHSRYEIHTPAAVTVVRSTDFRVFSDAEDDLTRSEVTEGGVNITAAGETVSVERGEGTLIEKGKPPAAPRKLLAAPDLTDLRLRTTMEGIETAWTPLVGAMAYRYRVANSEDRIVAGGTILSVWRPCQRKMMIERDPVFTVSQYLLGDSGVRNG